MKKTLKADITAQTNTLRVIAMMIMFFFFGVMNQESKAQQYDCPEGMGWTNGMVVNLPGAQAGQNIYVDFCYRCYKDPVSGRCFREVYIQHIQVTPCFGCDHNIEDDTSWYFQMAKGNLAWAMARCEPPFNTLPCECDCDPEKGYPICGGSQAETDSIDAVNGTEKTSVVVVGHAKCVLKYYLPDGNIHFDNCASSDDCWTEICYCWQEMQPSGERQIVADHNRCGGQISHTNPELGKICEDCKIEPYKYTDPLTGKITEFPPSSKLSVCEE